MSYKKGDLVKLSDFGKLISGDRECDVGVVLDGPYNLMAPLDGSETTYYEAYDLLVAGELMKRVPVEFLKRMTKDEKIVKRVEEVAKGDSPEGQVSRPKKKTRS